MRLYIPKRGDRLLLDADWTFGIKRDFRHRWIIKALKLEEDPDFAMLVARRDSLIADAVRYVKRTAATGASWEERVVLDHAKDKEATKLSARIHAWQWPVMLPARTVLEVLTVAVDTRDASAHFDIVEITHPTLSIATQDLYKRRVQVSLDDANKVIATPI